MRGAYFMKPPTTVRNFLRNLKYGIRGLLGVAGVFGRMNPPLLMVGSPNSGTTVLAETLGRHPDLYDRSEAGLLWDSRFHHQDETARRTPDEVTLWRRIRLRGNFSFYQWRTPAKRVLNKHPRNSLRIPYMREIFPQARILHIIRDGRAAVRSNLESFRNSSRRRKLPFGGFTRPDDWKDWQDRKPVERFAHMWNENVLTASREGNQLGEDYREILYENLEQNGTGIIQQTWEWLELEVPTNSSEKIPNFENYNHKWKQELSLEDVRTIERVAREGLEKFGYLPSHWNEKESIQ